jgi:UDPglucose--hexose-1-phosphate uridylyltransferase
MSSNFNSNPHRRYNILTGEWVLVSPHRTKRPWQGKTDKTASFNKESHDEKCYLCPENTRASGDKNPDYKGTHSFTNDFSALLEKTESDVYEEGLLKATSESGICRVVCFSPDHSLTLPLMAVRDIVQVISLWQKEYKTLGENPDINHVQIFENKGDIMGCSNPHPHGQIWAQLSIPEVVLKKQAHQKKYWDKHKRSLLSDYVQQELKKDERILLKNDHFE